MIILIVWIELNSIQATKSISVIQVINFAIVRVVFPYDCPDFLNIIWDNWDDQDNSNNHVETRLLWGSTDNSSLNQHGCLVSWLQTIPFSPNKSIDSKQLW